MSASTHRTDCVTHLRRWLTPRSIGNPHAGSAISPSTLTESPFRRSHRLGDYEISVGTTFGPRILSLRNSDSPEQFVELPPTAGITLESGERYTFRGGHRLWAAPEIAAITYAPDDESCEVTADNDQLLVVGSVDRVGLQKSILLTSIGDQLDVEHRLANQGTVAVMAAPWAITQLPTDGIALLPVRSDAPPSRQADRSVVLWPYSDLTDPRLGWHTGMLSVRATPGPEFKIGSGPDPGWIGYLRANHLFAKRINDGVNGEVPDRGASGQVFLGRDFCELETVGGASELKPGQSVTHTERWMVRRCDTLADAKKILDGA